MPDSGQGQQQTQDPQSQQSPSTPQAPEETENEKNFWARLETVVDGVIDKRIAAIRSGGTGEGQGSQRSGRTSVFDMFADWMGGPFAPPKQNKRN